MIACELELPKPRRGMIVHTEKESERTEGQTPKPPPPSIQSTASLLQGIMPGAPPGGPPMQASETLTSLRLQGVRRFAEDGLGSRV